MIKLNHDELTTEKLSELIDNKSTFEIVALSGRMADTVKLIENQIASKDLSCRIYTRGRIAAASGTLFGGITGFLGLASAVGIAAHNLATYKPDYEVAKHLVDNMLTVKYCK
jgi:hypothetical protein